MTTTQESPFKPGVRVAIEDWNTGTYREGFVDKIYKNGRIVLRGSKVQYGLSKSWSRRAWSLGNDHHPPIEIWDKKFDEWRHQNSLINLIEDMKKFIPKANLISPDALAKIAALLPEEAKHD